MSNKLKLLSGLPFYIGKIQIKPLKLREIAEIGEDKYNKLLSVICISKNQIKEALNTNNDLDPFDYIYSCCYQAIKNTNNEMQGYKELKEYANLITLSLSLFLNENYIFTDKGFFISESHVNKYKTLIEELEYFILLNEIKNEKDLLNFDDKTLKEYNLITQKLNDIKVINKSNFNSIVEIIKDQNCIKHEEKEEYNPANDMAKKFIERFKKNKSNAPKPKKEYGLYEIISSISWKTNIGTDVWDLTIYQLYDAFNRINIIDNYLNISHGIYSGSINPKKINFKEINWFRKIKDK